MLGERPPKQTAKWTEKAIGVPVLANHWYSREATIDEAGIEVWIGGAFRGGVLEPGTKIAVSDIITHEFEHYGVEEPETIALH